PGSCIAVIPPPGFVPRARRRAHGPQPRLLLLTMFLATSPSDKTRNLGDRLPTAMLATVLFASFVILAHLAVVLWLAWTSGSPGNQDLAYTTGNFVEVFTDQRTYTVLIDTLGFAMVSLGVALAFVIPAAWIAERT